MMFPQTLISGVDKKKQYVCRAVLETLKTFMLHSLKGNSFYSLFLLSVASKSPGDGDYSITWSVVTTKFAFMLMHLMLPPLII